MTRIAGRGCWISPLPDGASGRSRHFPARGRHKNCLLRPNLGLSVSARDGMTTTLFPRASALSSAEEAVEHFLQAVDLALVDVPAGLYPISEHRRTQS